MLLFVISFIAGVLTVLAPCVLPLLPVVVGGSLSTGSRRRAYTICVALGGSVLVFTLLLKASTAFISVPQLFWNVASGVILLLFGVVMLFPRLWDSLPLVNRMNRSSNALLGAGYQRNSLVGDMLMGAALGPVFASCSPTYFVILATVLPASFAAGFLDLLAYVVGLSGFLFLISLVGQRLVDRLQITIEPDGWFRRGLGILFLIVGLAVATGAEATAEAWLLSNGFDLTFIEQRLLGAPAGSSVNVNASATSTSFLSPQMKAAVYQKAPELAGIDGYINTDGKPIHLSDYVGKKVVLIDIWTYSCINCQRTLPYVKAWYAKYKDDGLEVIGVHTPEFAFEHVYDNVAAAVKQFGITYPVVLDNEYDTWNAFGNQFWPRKYLIDIDGYIAYDHAGEGNYDETEAAIRRALEERAARLGTTTVDMNAPASAPSDVVSVDFNKVGSPETYFGGDRNEYLANGRQGTTGDQSLTIPGDIALNALYLGGSWRFEHEYAIASKGDTIVFRYSAKNVYFVAAANAPTRIKVSLDGGAPGSLHGADIDADGNGTIQTNRLYQLIGGTGYATHTVKIEVEGDGLQAYTFTFG